MAEIALFPQGLELRASQVSAAVRGNQKRSVVHTAREVQRRRRHPDANPPCDIPQARVRSRENKINSPHPTWPAPRKPKACWPNMETESRTYNAVDFLQTKNDNEISNAPIWLSVPTLRVRPVVRFLRTPKQDTNGTPKKKGQTDATESTESTEQTEEPEINE